MATMATMKATSSLIILCFYWCTTTISAASGSSTPISDQIVVAQGAVTSNRSIAEAGANRTTLEKLVETSSSIVQSREPRGVAGYGLPRTRGSGWGGRDLSSVEEGSTRQPYHARSDGAQYHQRPSRSDNAVTTTAARGGT